MFAGSVRGFIFSWLHQGVEKGHAHLRHGFIFSWLHQGVEKGHAHLRHGFIYI